MDRYWLLTWTCYGTWLPGSSRGFVGNVRNADGEQVNHNVPGTEYDADMPLLEAYVREHMNGPPITLEQNEATVLIAQFQETARIRRWLLCAASVMDNHVHIVIGVPGDPDPQTLLETFKSWGTRALKKLRDLPLYGAFWTENGSKRKLQDEQAVDDAVVYVVKKQPHPLAIHYDRAFEAVLAKWELVNPRNASPQASPAA